MRILTIGFLALISWSVFSTYLYVCQIRGFCDDYVPVISLTTIIPEKIVIDSIRGIKEPAVANIPENLIIYFAYDKSDFKAELKAERYFDESSEYLKANTQAKISITGHSDATGSAVYNMDLGTRRAMSLKRYFEHKGIPSGLILIDSKGETEPAEENSTFSGRSKNRRTVITINK